MMQSNISSIIEDMRKKAIFSASDLEPWDSYFNLRAKEAEALLSVFDFPYQGLSLEIGCGNGFNSCLFSHKSKRIIATDLFNKDFKTHSQELICASKIFDSLKVSNCAVLSCSGQDLPFQEGLFDMIFSFNTLEHIPDRNKATQEMKRVLKKGGLAIIVVPSFLDRIFYPVVFYRDTFKRAFRYFSKLFLKNKNNIASEKLIASSNHKDISLKSFLKSHPNFPMPEPHGAYKTLGHEFVGYMPWKWLGLFKNNGFKIERVFSTILIPWQLLNSINALLPFKVYKRTALWNSCLGAKPLFKYLGSNICIVARKI